MPPVMSQVEVLRAACCVAGLDGSVNDAERPLLQRLADEAGVGQASLAAMIARAQRDLNFYQEQFRVLKPEAERTIRLLLTVAISDKDLSTQERVVVTHFAQKLGMAPERLDELLALAERRVGQAVE